MRYPPARLRYARTRARRRYWFEWALFGGLVGLAAWYVLGGAV